MQRARIFAPPIRPPQTRTMTGRQDDFESIDAAGDHRRRRVPLKAGDRPSNLGHQVLIRPGSQVMIPGKIMQRMRPKIMSKTNGIDDL